MSTFLTRGDTRAYHELLQELELSVFVNGINKNTQRDRQTASHLYSPTLQLQGAKTFYSLTVFVIYRIHDVT